MLAIIFLLAGAPGAWFLWRDATRRDATHRSPPAPPRGAARAPPRRARHSLTLGLFPFPPTIVPRRYEKIYNAVKDDSSLTYVKYFGGHMVHIGFLIVACISFPIGSNSYALAGIWPGIQFMHDKMTTLAVMYYLSAAFFGCAQAASTLPRCTLNASACHRVGLATPLCWPD